MELKAFTLIVLAEGFAVALLAILGMAVYIQKLKLLLRKAKAKEKAQQEKKSLEGSQVDKDGEVSTPPVDHLGASGAKNESQVAPLRPEKAYTDFIDEQILGVRDYHAELNGGQDISLDIDPSAPLERRIAAVRHAVLIAEREATLGVGDNVNWQSLKARYKALLSYYEDYPSPKAQARIKELDDALTLSQKQLASLDKYKSLYFDLEASWHASKTQADAYYEKIQGHVELVEGDSKSELVELVGEYHKSYDQVSSLFETKAPLPETLEVANEELRELRKMTAEQHQLIDDLRRKINNASDDNAKVELIRELESELTRQKRFLDESESCIQLMEDELTVTHKELQSLKLKLKLLPDLKLQIKELEGDAGVTEVMVGRLKDEVQKLKAALANTEEPTGSQAVSSVSGAGEVVDEGGAKLMHLQGEYDQLKKQYADLEERYLDLKLEG